MWYLILESAVPSLRLPRKGNLDNDFGHVNRRPAGLFTGVCMGKAIFDSL